MIVKAITDALSITGHNRLPGTNVWTLDVDYDGTYEAYKALPIALEFDGVLYGKSSHNSDTMRVCYRTDKKLAWVPK